MTINTKVKPTRLEKLIHLEGWIREKELGESDFEYRDHLKSLRLRVIAEIKLENAKKAQV